MWMLLAVAAASLLLAGCASQSTQAALSYARSDGRPGDEGQTRLVLAQCRGEAAHGVKDYQIGGGAIGWTESVISRSSKEQTLIDACMARNGYLAAQ